MSSADKKRKLNHNDALAHCITDHEFTSELQNSLVEFWRQGQGCDVKIQVPCSGGMVEVEAHRCVLAAQSKPLNQMLMGPMANVTAEGVLRLPEIDPSTARSAVEYLYTGMLKLTEENAFGMLATCSFLGLNRAKRLCAEFLERQLAPENALSMIEAAVRFTCQELHAASVAYTQRKFEEVSKGEEWVTLPSTKVESWARQDELRVASELTVIEALSRWAEHAKGAERAEAFASLFATLRLPQLKKGELETVRRMPLVAAVPALVGAVEAETARRAGCGGDGDVVESRCRRYKGSYAGPTECVRELGLNGTGMMLALVALDDDRVVAGYHEGGVRVWDVATGDCQRTIWCEDDAGVWSLALFGEMLFVGLSSGAIEVWSTVSWTFQCAMETRSRYCKVCSLLLVGDLLVSGCSDGRVRIWSTTTFEREHTLRGHNRRSGMVGALALCGDLLATGSADHTVKLWSTASWTCEHTLEGHTGQVKALAVQGDKLVSGSTDDSIKIWVQSGVQWACERTLSLGFGDIGALLVYGDKLVATFSNPYGKHSIVTVSTVGEWETEHAFTFNDEDDEYKEQIFNKGAVLALCGGFTVYGLEDWAGVFA